MFWGESTLHLKAAASILSLLCHQYGQIVFQVIWLHNETWGGVWDVLRAQKTTKTSLQQWIYGFFYYHSTHNLLICQLQVYFSQEHSSAYLRLFWGNMEGLWRPIEVKRWPKTGQNCMFWGKSTLYLKAKVSIFSLLRHHNGPTLCQVIQLQKNHKKNIKEMCGIYLRLR